VPNLNTRQRNAVRNAMMEKTRDLSFVKMIVNAASWSEAALRADVAPSRFTAS
jgi:hypothetical protein